MTTAIAGGRRIECGGSRMDLADLLGRVRATRASAEPLHATAATVWFALTDQLDSVDHAALGQIGLDALRAVDSAPEGFRRVISAPAFKAARQGIAEWWQLRPADQEAFALLGFLTRVAEIALVADEAARRVRLN